jgi:peptidoglycan/LPS O-acetylase OafA/YrhL
MDSNAFRESIVSSSISSYLTVRPAAAAAPAKPAHRIPALDFTKGALVLFMVLYHWLNYFVAAEGMFYRYLRFVTPSFIFITGFLVSNVYLSKYSVGDRRLLKRLTQRGLKILGIFVALNVAIAALFPPSYSGNVLFGHMSVGQLLSIFVTGNVISQSGKAAAFYILVPISYVLILSAGLMVVNRFYKRIFQAACLLSLAFALALSATGFGSANLELVAIGLLGVVIGYAPAENTASWFRNPYRLGGLYALYLIAITAWNVIYPLQVIGVCLTLIVIYIAGDSNRRPAGAWSHVILLGQYSLFGYISQIAILQLLYRGLRHVDIGRAALAVSLLAAFALTMLSVEILHRLRAKSATVNGLYKAVFC